MQAQAQVQAQVQDQVVAHCVESESWRRFPSAATITSLYSAGNSVALVFPTAPCIFNLASSVPNANTMAAVGWMRGDM